MKDLKDVLTSKGHDVWTISPDASVFEAIQLMSDKEVGALIVVDAGKLVGVVSERDYARKVILKGRSSREAKIREVMTPRVVYARSDQTIEESMALMTAKHIRHLPIMDDGKMIGIVSMGDLVKAVIAEQRFTIEQLERYITS